MQSLRGLRRAIPSTRPRHGFSECSYRSFTSSFVWCSTRGTEQSSTLRQGHDSKAESTSNQQQALKSIEPVNTSNNVDNDRTTAGAGVPVDAPALEASTEKFSQSENLCYSVTAVMAKLPHPAVVITTLDRTYEAQAAAGIPVTKMRHPIARGITASSLTSLCIRPRPHVMFNMNLPSTMYDALVACRDFNVHVLTPDEYGAGIASVFSRGNRLPSPGVGEHESPRFAFDIDADLGVFSGLKAECFRHVEIANREAWHEQYQCAKECAKGVESVAGDSKHVERVGQMHRVPCLRSRGVMEVLNCRLVRTIHPELPAAGPNVVIIGEVVNVTRPSGLGKVHEKPVALGYADRKYRSIGDVIHPLK